MDISVKDTEFSNSTHIQKMHRYCFDTEGFVHFGLLDIENKLHYFKAMESGISNIAAETYDLARAARHWKAIGNLDQFYASTLPLKFECDENGVIVPFLGAEMKIHRAAEHLDQLASMVQRYGEANNLKPVEIANDGENVTWQMQPDFHPPASVALLIGDTVHNLRSALDILICDVARTRGKDVVGLNFPFASNKNNLLKILNRYHRKIGDDLCDAIIDLDPVTGGNKNLRGLHDLDIIDKHRILIPSYFISWKRHEMAKRIVDQFMIDNPSALEPNLVFLGDDNTPFKIGENFVIPVGEEPLQYFTDLPDAFDVNFPGTSDMPFPHRPVLQTLTDLTRMTHDIVTEFRTRFGPSDTTSIP